MTEDARIAKEGLSAAIGVQVCATDADTPNPHQCLALGGRWWFWSLGQSEVAWLIQHNAQH
jgi:hypothetical protein